jgi:hypothetical protein
MNELAIVLIVVVVPVVASIFLYMCKLNVETLSICYGVEQDDVVEIAFESRNPIIATI